MCVNIVSLSGERGEKKKSLQASYIFSPAAFQFLLPLDTLHHHSPFFLPTPYWTPPCLWLQGVLRPFITVAMVTPQPFDGSPGHSSSLTHLLFLSSSIPLSLSSSVFPLHPPPPFNSPPCSSQNMASRQKSPNHSGKWGIWWWDDPLRFSSLPKHPINGWSNHNVLTLWSQVSIPLFSLSWSVCPPTRSSAALIFFFLALSSALSPTVVLADFWASVAVTEGRRAGYFATKSVGIQLNMGILISCLISKD